MDTVFPTRSFVLNLLSSAKAILVAACILALTIQDAQFERRFICHTLLSPGRILGCHLRD
jgi:hypothetical protein